MSVAVSHVFEEWSLPVWLTLSLAFTGVIYLRGWLAIRKTRPEQFGELRLASFLGGLVVLWVAIGSPMDAFADTLLSVHMVEHLILMSVVPPLLLCGLPVVPLLRGLPIWATVRIVSPLIRLATVRRLLHWLMRPVVAWFAMNLTFLAWHIPRAYDFALEHENWHAVEHLCFLGTSLLFWYCIVLPWPAATHPRTWGILIFLVSADVINTLLSAFLAFCDRPAYRYYVTHPNTFGIDPLSDQVLGAVIMWVLGSFAFLIPAMVITVRMLSRTRTERV
ncbi:Cytochrome c oxidase assembly factor CtaG [Granulicella rosea]|uniref:Cytochrome c oxidase assembly factor CtaG n=1 Tax=Granulicella rosea TaxID=474952 RepID=A0A239GUQ5_9BACT|nr:cytochrome c oxidase assembly protein [Granulicella rosea]SNS71794.1 Cytochrome c oxidase assembly factor CtaG [Granulicella rosea]